MHSELPSSQVKSSDNRNIARTLLETVSGNQTGMLAPDIVNRVQETTGYDRTTIVAILMDLGSQGVIGRSEDNPQIGRILTESGQLLLDHFDDLMPPYEG